MSHGDGPGTFHIYAGQLPVSLTTEAFSLNRFIEAREIYEEESRALFPTLPLSALVSTVMYIRQQRTIICAEGRRESTMRRIRGKAWKRAVEEVGDGGATIA